jgi:predicted component of type VI protein secretion system
VPEEFLIKVDASVSIEELKHLWEDSVKAGFSDQVSKLIADKRKALSNG